MFCSTFRILKSVIARLQDGPSSRLWIVVIFSQITGEKIDEFLIIINNCYSHRRATFFDA